MGIRRVPVEVALSLLIGLIAAIGLVDAALGEVPDLVVVFAMIVVVALIAAARTWTTRTRVAVRPDLVRWMTEAAAQGAESVDDVANRALGAYRAGLVVSAEPEQEEGE